MSEDNINQNEQEEAVEQEELETEQEEVVEETGEEESSEQEDETVSEEDVQEEADRQSGEDQKKLTQEEFNKIYFELKQKERENEELRRKAEAKPTQNDKKKTLEDFDYDHDAYTDYLLDTKLESKLSQKQEMTKEQEVITNFKQREAEYSKANPDYVKAVEENAQYVQYPPYVQQAIVYSDNGPALDHYLLTNPQVADKISGMGQAQGLMELGKLEAKLTSNSKPAKKLSKAPAPVPVDGGKGVSKKDPEKMSADEYYKKYFG